jgi:hypothetical protein
MSCSCVQCTILLVCASFTTEVKSDSPAYSCGSICQVHVYCHRRRCKLTLMPTIALILSVPLTASLFCYDMICINTVIGIANALISRCVKRLLPLLPAAVLIVTSILNLCALMILLMWYHLLYYVSSLMDQEVWCRDEMRLWFDKYADKSTPLYTSSNNSTKISSTTNSSSSGGFDQVLSKYMVPAGQLHNFN